MKGPSFLLIVLITLHAESRAEITPAAGPKDPRIRIAPYSAEEVYRVYGLVGYDMSLEFEPDETFKSVNGGDLQAILFKAQDNTFTFKPRVRAARMNLTVTTNYRRYYLEYSATDKASELPADQVMYVVRFSYPPKVTPARTSAEIVEERLASTRTARTRNFNYWFCGRSEIKPVAASDDGVHTRFTFAPRADLPAVFLRNQDGSESLVNFTVEGEDLLVHRVSHQWILRRGRLTGCVVNKSFAGGGEHLESGTVADDVERVSRAPRP